MRKIRLLSIVLALGLLIATVAGCSFVQGQKMDDVKGTYHLTRYNITDADTNKVTDYILEKGYEVYLVVTGTSTGYYVFKDNDTEQPWYKEVYLSYEYNTSGGASNSNNIIENAIEQIGAEKIFFGSEDSPKVEHVTYKFSQSDRKEYSFGVTKGGLNYSKPPYKPQIEWLNSLDGESWNWKKESDAIDLSYATAKLGEIVLATNN